MAPPSTSTAPRGPAPGDKNDGSDFSYRMVIEDRYKSMAKMRRNIKMATVVQVWYIVARSVWKLSPSLLLGACLRRVVSFPPLHTLTCPKHGINSSGNPYPITDVSILLAGVTLFFFYRYAFGYGKAQHEKLWAVMTVIMGNFFLLAEVFSVLLYLKNHTHTYTALTHIFTYCFPLFRQCFLTFWLYHINFGPKSIYPGVPEAYPPIPRALIAAAGLSGSSASIALKILDPFEKLIDVVGIGAILVNVVVGREYALDSREHKREQAARRAKQE